MKATIDPRAFGIAAHYGKSEIAVLVLCFLFVWER
jgi:hypothetical protein